jgi:hypothetical protein
MSPPKKRCPSRRRPRTGAKPSPSLRAVSTADRQSTSTTTSFGRTWYCRGPAVKVTGTDFISS